MARQQKILIIGGLIAVVGVVGYISMNYPPASQDAAGTIAPVQRFQADQGQSSTIGGGSQSTDQTSVGDAGQAGDSADARDARDSNDAADSRDAKDANDSADSRDAKDANDSADSRDAKDANDSK